MSIKQFNGSYLTHEDRILFRFNTVNQEEYRFWFTRRVTLFILAASSHLITKKLERAHSPDTAKAINEFEKEAVLEATKNQNPAEQTYESGSHFPIGSDPLLVMDVTCSLTKNGEKLEQLSDQNPVEIDQPLSIDFLLPAGANLNLKLTGNTLQTMCILLDQLRQQAAWGEAVLQAANAEKKDEKIDIKVSKNISLH